MFYIYEKGSCLYYCICFGAEWDHSGNSHNTASLEFRDAFVSDEVRYIALIPDDLVYSVTAVASWAVCYDPARSVN